MTVFLSKFLPLFIYPIGLACIFLVLAVFLRNKVHWKNFAIGLALLVLVVSGNRWISLSLVRSLEYRYIPQGEIESADVIVVLGGGTESQQYPRPSVEVNGAGDRILYAAQLYREGKAPNILLSGGSIGWLDSTSSTPAVDMALLLQSIGVPQEALWLETESLNTEENAANCAEILKEKGITRIILVTSAMHMPRSVALFEKQGLEVIPAPTDFTVTDQNWEALWHPDVTSLLVWLVPSSGNIHMTTNSMKEYIGMLMLQFGL